MIIEKYRGDFCVFVFMEGVDRSTEVKASLVDLGYDVYLFQDQDTLLDRVAEAQPHVIVFEPEALLSPLSEFVEKTLNRSAETSFLPICTSETAQALVEYREYNFTRFVLKGPNANLETRWEVDNLCERKLLEFQNLDLIEKASKYEKENQDLIQQVQSKSEVLQELSEFSAESYSQRLKSAQSREDMIELFLSSLGQVEERRGLQIFAIYFKFLPTVQSLVATSAHGLDVENLKGVGGKLTSQEIESLESLSENNKLPASLERVLEEGLFAKSYKVKLLKVGRLFEGVFVFWSSEALNFEVLANEFALFSQQYLILYQTLRLAKIDIQDPVTELLSQSQYFSKLEEELARAQRLQQPVSLVRLSIDNYSELAENFGPHQIDVILRSISLMIKKSSRVNDLAFRLEDSQMALILPHCSRKGAALRAERLRRLIETHSFTTNGFKLTVSVGISEYPSLCANANDLDTTSLEALEHIQTRGGNKVCLFKAPDQFQPDFAVEEE